jgi:hypothetical protein
MPRNKRSEVERRGALYRASEAGRKIPEGHRTGRDPGIVQRSSRRRRPTSVCEIIIVVVEIFLSNLDLVELLVLNLFKSDHGEEEAM